MSEIVISIKPKYVNLIVNKIKNYEFRGYIPNKGVSRLWVYSTYPEKKIQYVIDVDYIISYPDTIDKNGIGNTDFNNGKKDNAHAYHIKHLYELSSPLNLDVLRKTFNFTAPQRFFYLDNNITLSRYLNNITLNKIF